ncbi:MAG TPA: hypothetical protein VFQ70_02870, partial [Candidatus Saccharimonadaceae bacterium]|nr:hypothetical protein [Candidatus Saccharimonadaceae bacterium]
SAYDSPFNYVRVQVYLYVFLLFTSIVGIIKAVYTDQFSIAIAWNIINTIVFGYFTHAALREARLLRREHKRERRRRKLKVVKI